MGFSEKSLVVLMRNQNEQQIFHNMMNIGNMMNYASKFRSILN